MGMTPTSKLWNEVLKVQYRGADATQNEEMVKSAVESIRKNEMWRCCCEAGWTASSRLGSTWAFCDSDDQEPTTTNSDEVSQYGFGHILASHMCAVETIELAVAFFTPKVSSLSMIDSLTEVGKAREHLKTYFSPLARSKGEDGALYFKLLGERRASTRRTTRMICAPGER